MAAANKPAAALEAESSHGSGIGMAKLATPAANTAADIPAKVAGGTAASELGKMVLELAATTPQKAKQPA